SPPTAASSPPTDHGPDLGCVTTSHIDGRAGWWKSPCPDLARGRGGKPPGLLYKALVRQRFGARPLEPLAQPPAATPRPRLFPCAQRRTAPGAGHALLCPSMHRRGRRLVGRRCTCQSADT